MWRVGVGRGDGVQSRPADRRAAACRRADQPGRDHAGLLAGGSSARSAAAASPSTPRMPTALTTSPPAATGPEARARSGGAGQRRLVSESGVERLEHAVGDVDAGVVAHQADPPHGRARWDRGRRRSRSRARAAAGSAPRLPSTPSGTRTAVSGASWCSGSARSSSPRAVSPPAGGRRRAAWRSQRCAQALERDLAQRLVQRVDVQHRGGVVVDGRPLRPSSARAASRSSEKETGWTRARIRSSAAVGDGHRGHPGRRAQALLGARVGVVDPPAVEVERRRRPARSRSRPSAAPRGRAARGPARPADARLRWRSRRGRRPAGEPRDAHRAPPAAPRWARSAPVGLHLDDLGAEAMGDLDDPPAEEAVDADDRRVARLEQVGESRLHARGAGGLQRQHQSGRRGPVGATQEAHQLGQEVVQVGVEMAEQRVAAWRPAPPGARCSARVRRAGARAGARRGAGQVRSRSSAAG